MRIGAALVSPAAVNDHAIYLQASGSRLLRVDRRTMTVTRSARIPNLIAGAVGAGGLWAATGEIPIDAGCNCTPPPASHVLLKLDPTTLSITDRFTMPGPPQLVSVAAGQLWVATPDALLRVDPTDGKILNNAAFRVLPYAMAVSPDERRVYVLGDAQPHGPAILADFSAATGDLLARATVGLASVGPLAATASGVWVPDQQANGHRSNATALRFFSGPRLRPARRIPANSFDATPFAAGDTLWVNDDGGQNPTVCRNPDTGHVRATGSPLGVGAVVLTDAGRTYLLRNVGVHALVLQIQPTRACD